MEFNSCQIQFFLALPLALKINYSSPVPLEVILIFLFNLLASWKTSFAVQGRLF